MPSETVKPNPSSMDGRNLRQVDHGVREMVSALTNRLTNLHQVHKSGSSGQLGDEEEHGVRIITLAGTNTGAVMKGQMLGDPQKNNSPQHEASPDDELEGLDTYVNSNYQAVNNSIMLGATYTSNDPGVHMDIVDLVDRQNHRHEKHGRKELRKGKEPLHENPPTDHSEGS